MIELVLLIVLEKELVWALLDYSIYLKSLLPSRFITMPLDVPCMHFNPHTIGRYKRKCILVGTKYKRRFIAYCIAQYAGLSVARKTRYG